VTLCLTRAELAELSGRKRRSAIIAWLRARGIPFWEDADGWPKVLRASILDQQEPKPHHSEPRLRPA